MGSKYDIERMVECINEIILHKDNLNVLQKSIAGDTVNINSAVNDEVIKETTDCIKNSLVDLSYYLNCYIEDEVDRRLRERGVI